MRAWPRTGRSHARESSGQCAAAAISAAFPFGFRRRKTRRKDRTNAAAGVRNPLLNARTSTCVSSREAISA